MYGKFEHISRFQANVHSIMGSEDQVQDLMLLIDRALLEANQIEGVLDGYDKELEVKYCKKKKKYVSGLGQFKQHLKVECKHISKVGFRI